MLGGLFCPVLEGVPIHLCDAWDPSLVLNLMTREESASAADQRISSPACWIIPSSPTPPSVHALPRPWWVGGTERGHPSADRAGLVVTRSYGSTDTRPSPARAPTAPPDKRLLTDGAAAGRRGGPIGQRRRNPQSEDRICASATSTPELSAKAFDDDGWYHTGDIGVLDDDGYLTITDRKSDVIIRGGENISAIEVEEALLAMPEVAEAVVVAAPDERFGERVVAVLRIRPGHQMPTGNGCARTSRPREWPARSGRKSCSEVDRLSPHRERQGAEIPSATTSFSVRTSKES